MAILLRKNPFDQNAGNVLSVPERDTMCCGDDSVVCQHASAAIPNADTFTAFEYIDGNGQPKTVTFSPAISSNSALADAISKELLENGYLFNQVVSAGPAVFVVQSATTKVVYINSDVVPVKLVANANNIAFTCEQDTTLWVKP